MATGCSNALVTATASRASGKMDASMARWVGCQSTRIFQAYSMVHCTTATRVFQNRGVFFHKVVAKMSNLILLNVNDSTQPQPSHSGSHVCAERRPFQWFVGKRKACFGSHIHISAGEPMGKPRFLIMENIMLVNTWIFCRLSLASTSMELPLVAC